ncbi:hypothetical protein BDK51DRAFT_29451 [Blyttiomyces helicus]|uniref:Uncharacterized protein n=1 Tax=Blyttiomyces helicus TaxID=388810 RepID=A0A4P9WHS7_9FUNG|nr:hypothetical protein BDK51DRAFT_29451 [Blyttiomyces helicus]|eukprot:RKO92389.1 hypothetical protein BDK51DRAFT_29451 [Blyttiomyces helicus]
MTVYHWPLRPEAAISPTLDVIFDIDGDSFPMSPTEIDPQPVGREIRRFALDVKMPHTMVTAAFAKMGLHGSCGVVHDRIQVVDAGPPQRMDDFWLWILEFRYETFWNPITQCWKVLALLNPLLDREMRLDSAIPGVYEAYECAPPPFSDLPTSFASPSALFSPSSPQSPSSPSSPSSTRSPSSSRSPFSEGILPAMRSEALSCFEEAAVQVTGITVDAVAPKLSTGSFDIWSLAGNATSMVTRYTWRTVAAHAAFGATARGATLRNIELAKIKLARAKLECEAKIRAAEIKSKVRMRSDEVAEFKAKIRKEELELKKANLRKIP